MVWSCQQTKRFIFGEEFKVLVGVGQGGLVGESVGAEWQMDREEFGEWERLRHTVMDEFEFQDHLDTIAMEAQILRRRRREEEVRITVERIWRSGGDDDGLVVGGAPSMTRDSYC